MDPNLLFATIEKALPGVRFERGASVDLQPTIYVSREDLPAVARVLRDNPDAGFGLLVELTAIDWSPREPRFEVVYILVAIEHRLRLRVKVRLPGDDPRLATVSDVWPAASWLEREVWDMFGIGFDGHPDPRRLLMPEDWEGHPLRKDYPVQIRMPARVAEPLQVTAEGFRASLERDRLVRRS
jgi:NADH-quinone oxidoreductase subunit C